jgi:hypothetical protein
MPARRQTLILLSLLFSGTACARLFPATQQDEQRGRVAMPQVDKTSTARRGGSDVTLPKEKDSIWPAVLIPACTRSDSGGARQPTDSDCRPIDKRADTLRTPHEAVTNRRP